MINLEVPRRFRPTVAQARRVATEVLRPNSRTYDQGEHDYPKELDLVAACINGFNDAAPGTSGAAGVRRSDADEADDTADAPARKTDVKNGSNMSSMLSVLEMSWGDLGLILAMPDQGLGNSAIASVANDEQFARFGSKWAAMAITEPDCGSDSAAITTTAVLDGDDYIINGQKIFVTSGARADAVVVWATLDKTKGRAAIKSFLVEKGTPGFSVERLEHKLGIRASDTAVLRFENCRVPATNLLGSPEIDVERGFAGAMQTFDNTRPLVAAMGIGIARAALEETRRLLDEAGVQIDYDRPAQSQSAAAATYLRLEADYEASYLLAMRAAWLADNGQPNSLQASMAKAKAGRSATEIALTCVELAGSVGYAETSLLEKWARDAKITDIFEGTQEIQKLVIARRLLGLSSEQLR